MIETPAGRLIGHDGAIPGFLNIVLSIEHGRRQVGIMMNEEFATPAVSEAFMALAIGLLERAPLGRASPSAYLRAAVETRESARTAQALAGTAVRAQH